MTFYASLIALLCFAQLSFSEQRPQEPKRPYPYCEEEVSFTNAAAGITLSGTLTVPQTQGPHPAVILLHGSAPLDRDSAMLGHKPFLVWADYLTRQGIAVLRFDKRSAGKSMGDYSTSTVQDFANDAIAAVEYLKTRKEISTKQIGLIGHSEGGITSSIAASKSKDVAFMVLMAAPAVNSEKLVHLQETLLQRADGVEEKVIAKNRNMRKRVFAVLKTEKNQAVAEQKLNGIFDAYLQALTPEQRKIAEAYYGPKEAQIAFFNSTPFRYWVTFDPLPILKQVKIPILALNGDLDLIVTPEQNLDRIASALEEVHHKDHTIIKLPNLNHAFQTCEKGTMSECASIEETASPLVLQTLSKWILERTTEKK